MKVTVECYGASQRWCGAESVVLELADGATVADALDQLCEHYGDLAQRRETIAVAIGDSIVASSQRLGDDERMALIPPVSGG